MAGKATNPDPLVQFFVELVLYKSIVTKLAEPAPFMRFEQKLKRFEDKNRRRLDALMNKHS